MIAFIMEEGYQIDTDEEHLYNFVISISTGELKFEEIVVWLKKNTSPVQ